MNRYIKFSKSAFIGILVILFFSNFEGRLACFQKSFIEVYFSNKLNIDDLAKIKTDLSKKEINLNYDYLKFGDDGKLVAIKYYVKGEKFGGGDEADSLNNNEIGFIINTSLNRKYNVIVGSKKSIQKKRIALENQE